MATNTVEFANHLLAENENLKQRIIALESDAKLSTETLKNADKVVLAAKAKFDQICADNAALAAENIALKHAMSVTLEHVSVTDAGHAGVAAMIINDTLHNNETPATDAAIRELQAQGVDKFAAAEKGWADQWEKHGVNDGSVNRSRMVVQDAQKFAAAIRAGELLNA